MSEFQREERYIVVKLSDLRPFGGQEETLRDFLHKKAIPTRECVVVESDWPIYDETWENVQRLAEGRPSIRHELSMKLSDQHHEMLMELYDRTKAKVKAEAERDALRIQAQAGESMGVELLKVEGERDELRQALELLEATCGEGWLGVEHPIRVHARAALRSEAKGE